MEQTQKSSGNKTLLYVLLGLVLFFSIIVAVCIVNYISAHNYGNRLEEQLKAVKENNKNIYAQGTQKVLEIAQVPGMYRDDFAALIKQDIEGRYGPNGSQASFQFLKEHQINLDPNMYTKIQQTVEAFREDFKINQTRMIDVKRSYSTELGTFWSGLWLRMAGYPKINLADYVPITTDNTEQVYKDGKEKAPLKLR